MKIVWQQTIFDNGEIKVGNLCMGSIPSNKVTAQILSAFSQKATNAIH